MTYLHYRYDNSLWLLAFFSNMIFQREQVLQAAYS